jgi:hypothetical protein
MGPVTAGLGVASLASQIYGGIKGAQANKATQDLLNKQIEENEAFYNRNVNRDFLETNVAKGMFERLRKDLEKATKTVESKGEATGATAEEKIAEKSDLQENYNENVSRLAEGATQYQQGQEAMYRGEKGRLTDQQMVLNQQRAEQAANLASNAANAMSSGASLTGFENIGKNPPILSRENLSNWKDIEPYRGILFGS